jgi:hypothetical protein
MKVLKFSDVAAYDSQMKSVVSVRDGVLEYLGSELGISPADKIFYVYRSPATIASAASLMTGIPLLGDHIEPGTESDDAASKVESASLIDAFDSATAATLAIRNVVSLDAAMQRELESGKRELSLGYTGSLVPHDEYDFEQRDIIPTHLAVVERGRCGSGCRFLDKKPTKEAIEPMKKLHKAFLDAEGSLSLSQIVELAAGLPEAIKNVPADKLAELLPALQEIMSVAEAAGVKPAVAEIPDDETMTDEDEAAKPAEPAKVVPITDSAAFKDAVGSAVKTHAVVIDKARTFVDEAYNFGDKSTNQIMRDALAVEHGSTQFTDAELAVAFKLLKKPSQDYRNFADHQAEGGLTARVKESMKGDQ